MTIFYQRRQLGMILNSYALRGVLPLHLTHLVNIAQLAHLEHLHILHILTPAHLAHLEMYKMRRACKMFSIVFASKKTCHK